MAHLARREDTRHAGLKIIGFAIHLLGLRKRRELAEIGASDEITLGVAHNSYLLRPLGVWHATQTEELEARLDGALCFRCAGS